MSNPTADWERVGDRFYRKIKLYDAVFDQDLELENYVIVGAPCGGAIGTNLSWTASQVQKLMTSQRCIETKTSFIHTEDHRLPSLALISTAAPGIQYVESMWVIRTHDGALDVAATDVYSGIKAQYVD